MRRVVRTVAEHGVQERCRLIVISAPAGARDVKGALMAAVEEGFPLLIFQLNVSAKVFLPDGRHGNSQFFM